MENEIEGEHDRAYLKRACEGRVACLDWDNRIIGGLTFFWWDLISLEK
jgi:hypothetical protein